MIQKSPYQIILRPVITEKSQLLSTQENAQFIFEVEKGANKREIKWAVEAAYGVKVKSVNTLVLKGKNRYSRSRGGVAGKRPDVKKAIVTLAEGQQIELL